MPPLPGSEEIADGVPGTDEHLGLVAAEDGGLAGRDLNVPVYLHWFRMIICGRNTRKGTCMAERHGGPPARAFSSLETPSHHITPVI